MIFATRHITGELLRATGLGKLRTVSAFATGVLGETGAEAGEMLKGLWILCAPRRSSPWTPSPRGMFHASAGLFKCATQA